MIAEIKLMGVCAFCENSNHDFAHDKWHERMHDEMGWHSCDVFGGFRGSKPMCDYMELSKGAVVG